MNQYLMYGCADMYSITGRLSYDGKRTNLLSRWLLSFYSKLLKLPTPKNACTSQKVVIGYVTCPSNSAKKESRCHCPESSSRHLLQIKTARMAPFFTCSANKLRRRRKTIKHCSFPEKLEAACQGCRRFCLSPSVGFFFFFHLGRIHFGISSVWMVLLGLFAVPTLHWARIPFPSYFLNPFAHSYDSILLEFLRVKIGRFYSINCF